MSYSQISDYIYNCNVCPTRCDGVSKGSYIFSNDTAFSEQYEQEIIQKINRDRKYFARKCEQSGYPDIEVLDFMGRLVSYIEVKVQQRTFMSVEKVLPDSGLKPSETLALNLSDLRRYFQIEEETGISTSIVWVVMNRPCLVPNGEVRFYRQDIMELQEVFIKEQDKRRFKRKSGEGDVVGGIHKGVTVNYHFSLKELIPWAL